MNKKTKNYASICVRLVLSLISTETAEAIRNCSGKVKNFSVNNFVKLTLENVHAVSSKYQLILSGKLFVVWSKISEMLASRIRVQFHAIFSCAYR